MMINCPNCNLLQPKDQYCAQCGINMETWKPPRVPLWKRLLGNWMVQLAALFAIIFVVVLRDNFSGPTKSSRDRELPPVAKSIERDSSYEANAPEPESAAMSSQNFAPQKKEVNLETTSVQGRPVGGSQKALPLLRKASVKLFTISRAASERLFQSAQRVDEMAVVMDHREAVQFLRENRNELKSMGSTRGEFELGQPLNLFLGEQDVDSGFQMGFFVQVTVSNNATLENMPAEVRFWNQLKVSGVGSPQASWDIPLSAQKTLFIVDPSIHDLDFSNEERGLFDSSPILRPLNGEGFIDSDIGLVLELK